MIKNKKSRFIPSQRIKGSDKELFIINYEGSVIEVQRTSNLYEPLIIRLDGELLETVPSKQNKEIEFSTADGKHKLQVWNERVENTLIPKIFVKDGIAIVIDGVPVQNSLADPITRLNSGKAIIWLLTILLFVKGFIIPLTFIQEFKETQHLIILFVYIILFILSLSAALTFRLNPLRATWIALVISIIESAEFFYSILLTRDFSILTILFTALRLGIIGSLIFSLRNLKHILSYDQDTIAVSMPTEITENNKIRKRFSFSLKYTVIIIVSLVVVAGIYYGISEFILGSKYPSIERDSSLEFRTDLQKMNLNDKVKSISEFSYEAIDKFGVISKGKKIRESPFEIDKYILFNEVGNQVEEDHYNSEGNLFLTYTFEYDDKGNQVEWNTHYSASNLDEKLIYKYDSKGRKIEMIKYNSSGSLDVKCTYKYDEQGNLIDWNTFNEFGYKYDEQGNVIDWNAFNEFGKLINKTIYKYDDIGNQIEMKWYDSDGNILARHTYNYDDKGNKIEVNWHTPTAFIPRFIYKYDYHRNIIEEYIYNSEGSLDLKKSYEYEYDNKSNWIKKIVYIDNFPAYILERKIVYYN